MDIISTRTLLLLIYITFGRTVHAQTDEETSLEESLGEGSPDESKVELHNTFARPSLPPNIQYGEGPDGDAAFEFISRDTTGKLVRDVFPAGFFDEFLVIEGNISPKVTDGIYNEGFLLSFLDITESDLLLGVRIKKIGSTEIAVEIHAKGGVIVEFRVPIFHGTWKKFVITITDEESRLYIDDASAPILASSIDSGIPNLDSMPTDAKVFLGSRGPSNDQYEGLLTEMILLSTSDLHSAVTAYLGEPKDPVDTEGSGSGSDGDDELDGDIDREVEVPELEDTDDEDAPVSRTVPSDSENNMFSELPFITRLQLPSSRHH